MIKHSFLWEKVFFWALYFVLFLHPFFDYHHVSSLALSNRDVSEKRIGMAIGRNVFSKQLMGNNKGIAIKRVKWEPLLRNTFLEDNPQRKSIVTLPVSRSSDSEKNDNFYDKSEQNLLFRFVLAGDQDLEQIKNCCVEQLKGGVLTTIDSIIHEIDTLTIDREAFFVNINNLEGKIKGF